MKKLLVVAGLVALAASVWYVRDRDSAAPAPTPGAPTSGAAAAPVPDLVGAVRAAGNAKDFVAGADMVAADRATHGITPQNLEAQSWLGRTALAAGDLDRAERFARESYNLGVAMLRQRSLDAEPRLPIALGASIEVLGQVAARRGARTEAVAFLQAEVDRYRDTSIAKRIQKNVNLISLEGTEAPALDLSEHLGRQGGSLESLRGRVVLMFFWAHWCSDCKAQAPVLEALETRYKNRGLTIVAPTQRFGYVAGGETAPPDQERTYIAEIRQKFYPSLEDAAIPLAAANHLRYGVSSTPTLVLVDRNGIIRLYRPGLMKEAELEALVRGLIEAPLSPSTTG